MAHLRRRGAASASRALPGAILALERAIMLQQMQFRSFAARMGAMHVPANAVSYAHQDLIRAQGVTASSAGSRPRLSPPSTCAAQLHNSESYMCSNPPTAA